VRTDSIATVDWIDFCYFLPLKSIRDFVVSSSKSENDFVCSDVLIGVSSCSLIFDDQYRPPDKQPHAAPLLTFMAAKKSLLQRELEDSSSDDDDCFIFSAATTVEVYSKEKRRHGGSVPGHIVIHRDRESRRQRMYQDYLANNSTFGPNLFRRRLVCIHLLHEHIMLHNCCMIYFKLCTGTG
jgi:hypothetical protein